MIEALSQKFLEDLLGGEVSERFLNPIVSNYQKRLEKSGWELITNHNLYSFMDDLTELKQISGDKINLRTDNEPIRSRIRRWGEYYKNIFSADRIRFLRAYDVNGDRLVPRSDSLLAGVYIKRRLS
jgi:hypothetical protein